MEEQTTETATIYEPPVLVELGEFGVDTLGFGQDVADNVAQQTQ